jgi:hypothetical protein
MPVVIGQVVQALFGLLAFGDVGEVGDQADRAVFQVAQRRERQAGPEDVAGFFAAPHFHQAAALFGEDVALAGVVVSVQEQDVVADGFDCRVAEQRFGAAIPAGDVAEPVHCEDRLVDLVEDLRLVRQLRFHLHVRVRGALGQRLHLQQAGHQRGQGRQRALGSRAFTGSAGEFKMAVLDAVGFHCVMPRTGLAQARARAGMGNAGDERGAAGAGQLAGDAAKFHRQHLAAQAQDGVARSGAGGGQVGREGGVGGGHEFRHAG